MLLEEVNCTHQGTYDFFYLPIDFKNSCNVGYGFISFLQTEANSESDTDTSASTSTGANIHSFVSRFSGSKWKLFNSEKVCDVTWARIQSKHAMVVRFQNSSLLEKHNVYRPLLFHSDGPSKGEPEPFPLGSRYN